MNFALIFAGGSGQRMRSAAKPKQLLELGGKAIIIHTLEKFENHPMIDGIVIVSLSSAIPEIKKLVKRFEINKVLNIVPGGETGFESILNGLESLNPHCGNNDLILIHDGVRPLVDDETITNTINCALKYGNAIAAMPVIEGVLLSSDGKIADDFPDRNTAYSTKAPQVFNYSLIYDLYKRAKADKFVPVESAHLCHKYGIKLHIVQTNYENIKVTTPTDFYICRAIFDARENSQIIGY